MEILCPILFFLLLVHPGSGIGVDGSRETASSRIQSRNLRKLPHVNQTIEVIRKWLPEVQKTDALLTQKLDAIDEAKNTELLYEEVVKPIFELAGFFGDIVEDDDIDESEKNEQINSKCSNSDPRNVYKKLGEKTSKELVKRISDVYAYSSESISDVIWTVYNAQKQLLLFDRFCAFQQGREQDFNFYLQNYESTAKMLSHQVNDIKGIYFPESAKYVVNQFLDQMSSESYAFTAKEIKEYNQKVTSNLIEYLDEYYLGFDTFAGGLNRAGIELVGKVPADVAFQVSTNGWTGFIYRSDNSQVHENVSTTRIYEILDTYQDSSTENALCEDGQPAKTAAEVFKAISGTCGHVRFCAIMAFSNLGLYSTNDNLQSEKFSLCNSMEFQGFHLLGGLHDSKYMDGTRTDPEWTAHGQQFKAFFDSFVDGQKTHPVRQLIQQYPVTTTAETRTASSLTIRSTEESIKEKDKPIPAPTTTPAPTSVLEYVKDMEHVPLDLPPTKPILFDTTTSPQIIVKIASLQLAENDLGNRSTSNFVISELVIFTAIVLLVFRR